MTPTEYLPPPSPPPLSTNCAHERYAAKSCYAAIVVIVGRDDMSEHSNQFKQNCCAQECRSRSRALEPMRTARSCCAFQPDSASGTRTATELFTWRPRAISAKLHHQQVGRECLFQN